MKPSTSEAVSAALAEILRDDMNVDIRRITRDSRLIDDVGLDSVAFAVGMVAIEDRLGVASERRGSAQLRNGRRPRSGHPGKTSCRTDELVTELAAALSAAMTGAPTKLAVLDTESGEWVHHPWQEVHARAENVAERIAGDGANAVGLIGDPTVEFIAAIPGTFFAGAAVSILPGPIRRADPHQWAQATLDRFRSTGVTTVFSHGAQLELLRGRDDAIVVHDLVEVAHARRSTTVPRARARRRRDPAGHGGLDGNASHGADFARGVTG